MTFERIENRTRQIDMIGNAHIDPVWLWRWPEGYHEVRATFRSALDRMKEYPEFCFISSSAQFYAWIEECDPEMFAEIQTRVKEGRWGIVGGWWIQPDCNIPGGESFVRQALYAQYYFKEKFGVIAQVGYNVDSFGHHGMLPQLLKKSGLNYYIFMRPSPHEKGLPGRVFWWEADDGSRVLAYRLPYEYCSWGKDLEQNVRRVAGELQPPQNRLMCFYGVGNHGGGPTRENIESIRELGSNPELPRLAFNGPEVFFEEQASRNGTLPVVHDDLQHHASGCYSAHSGIKRWNRQAENCLMAAEKLAAVAYGSRLAAYPGDFAQAWKDVLFNQFHDTLAGTAIEEAYEDAAHLYGEALSIAARAMNRATQALAWQIGVQPEEGMRPLVVFNPLTWEQRTPVEVEMTAVSEGDTLLDPRGNVVPYQTTQTAATAKGRSRIVFVDSLPSLGYKLYRMVKRDQEAGSESELPPASQISIENARFRLELDPQNGTIRSLYDKQAGVEVFSGEAAKAVVIDDPSDTWSHNVFRFDQVEGCFRVRRVSLVARGPVKSTLRVESSYGASTLVQDFNLYQGVDRIDVQVTVDWREQFKMLKLRFPLNLNFMRTTYEIPYGTIERQADGTEEPFQSWLDVTGINRDSGETYGLSVLNDGKYSADVAIRDIGLTVLRSPIYAHHMPVQPEEGALYSFIDQSIQHFTYALLPHMGSWEEAGTARQAAALNQTPITLLGTYHPEGDLAQEGSYLSVDCENILISVLKKAEDGEDLVLRAVETAHRETQATIGLPHWGRQIRTKFGPAEIKTWRIPAEADRLVVETNLLEWSD